MIVYLDSSVLLRVVLGQAGSLKEWKKIERAVASALIEVECLHTLDRLRLADGIPDTEIALRREAVFQLVDAIELVDITRSILNRAAQPMPTILGTLDAIHLATALMWSERFNAKLTVATHDSALALASRASGFDVIGA